MFEGIENVEETNDAIILTHKGKRVVFSKVARVILFGDVVVELKDDYHYEQLKGFVVKELKNA